jgi:ribonuclease BN (tRNA processing enzyme)
MEHVEVTFLGSGDAFCSAGRSQAAYLVQAGGATVLLDCGATTLAALKRAGCRSESIDTIFLSHLHGDHFAGLPFFFLEYVYQEPRRRPLRIAGPPGTEARVADLFRAMYRDSAAEGLPYPLEFVELEPGAPADVCGVRVAPFRVPHTENDISLGLLLEVGGRRLLYSGDTGWTEELVRRSEGTDLFICECSLYETRLGFHLDYPRLAENRHRFGTRRLILTHLGREVLARSAELEMELARDGLRIDF